MLLFLQMVFSTAVAAPAQNPSGIDTVVAVPPTSRDGKQCFTDGRSFPPGTVINSDRSFDWCHGRYCDFDGIIIHWEDFNCGRSSGSATLKIKPHTSRSVMRHAERRTLPPIETPPTATSHDFLGSSGCWYRGQPYWAGEDIENLKRGHRCFGTYCDWSGKVQWWQDDCKYTIPPPALGTATVDYT